MADSATSEGTEGKRSMNIIVCVKQVPGTTKVEVDPVTGVLKRDGIESKLNPYDLFALEMALRLREQTGGEVRTLSMGPPQAAAALEETVAIGADGGVLLSDRKFAGSDVHATSCAIRCGIEKMAPYDLIICGKQTTDGDTAQVGPEVAEMLGIEHASNVTRILSVDTQSITVQVNLDDCLQTQRMRLPCLLTIEKDACTPRLPSYRRRQNCGADAVHIYSAADLDADETERFGLKGSLTQVERIFPPVKNDDKQVYEGDAEALEARLRALLIDRRFI